MACNHVGGPCSHAKGDAIHSSSDTGVIEDQGSSRFFPAFFMAIHNLSEEEVKKYEEAFRPLDKDGSGVGRVQTRCSFCLMTRFPPWLKGCSVDCFH